MKIGLIFQRFGPYHFARLRGAAGSGVQVVGIELSPIDRTYEWARREPGDDLKFVTLFRDKHTADLSFGQLYEGVSRALQDARVEGVAIPGWASRGALAALAWCRQNAIPAILMSDSAAQDKPRKWWSETLKRRVVTQFDSALVGGQPHVRYLVKLGMAPERILTGYDVVDNDHFARGSEWVRSKADEHRAKLGLPAAYFLASSRFIHKKNLPRMLQAFAQYRARARKEAWGLVLLGDGPLRATLERQVRAARLESCVHLPGFKQYEELPAYYGLAGAFVHASTTEQWGLVVNEAMASGLPLIVSERCGCASDLVSHGENGFTFDPYDVETLASRMQQMAADECDREVMGIASRCIISHWTPRTFAENLVKAAQAAQAAPMRRATMFDRGLLRALARR